VYRGGKWKGHQLALEGPKKLHRKCSHWVFKEELGVTGKMRKKKRSCLGRKQHTDPSDILD
jgi:hypothetical protein